MKTLPIILFLLYLSSNLLRIVKDSTIAVYFSPSFIPYISILEFLLILPLISLFKYLYSKISIDQVFILIIGIFALILTVFLMFYKIISPINNHLSFLSIYNLKGLHFLLHNLHYILLFILVEIWPLIIVNILFWQLVNSRATLSQAQKKYPFINMIGQINIVFSALIAIITIQYGADILSIVGFKNTLSGISTQRILIVVISTLIVVLTLHTRYLKKVPLVSNNKLMPTLANKENIFTMIKGNFQNKFLSSITIYTFIYFYAICILDVFLLYLTKDIFTNIQEFSYLQALIMLLFGILIIFFSFFSKKLLTNKNWQNYVIITPFLLTLSGSMLFAFCVFLNLINVEVTHSIKFSLLLICILIKDFTKATKYTIFDMAKEMSFINKSYKIKTSGKAFIEMFGAQFGKLSFAITGLLILFVTLFLLIVYRICIDFKRKSEKTVEQIDKIELFHL